MSDGGLACAVAEMCIGGRLGATIDLDKAPACGDMNLTGLLYSESASRFVVTVPKEKQAAFEARFAGQKFACVGEVAADETLVMTSGGNPVVSTGVEGLAQAFKATLDW